MSDPYDMTTSMNQPMPTGGQASPTPGHPTKRLVFIAIIAAVVGFGVGAMFPGITGVTQEQYDEDINAASKVVFEQEEQLEGTAAEAAAAEAALAEANATIKAQQQAIAEGEQLLKEANDALEASNAATKQAVAEGEQLLADAEAALAAADASTAKRYEQTAKIVGDVVGEANKAVETAVADAKACQTVECRQAIAAELDAELARLSTQLKDELAAIA